MLGAFLFYCRGGLDVEAAPPVPAAMAAAVAAATACMAADVATAVADAVAVIAAPMLLLHAAASAKSTWFILDLVRFKFSILGRLPEDSSPCNRGQNPEGPKVEVQEIWNERARA